LSIKSLITFNLLNINNMHNFLYIFFYQSNSANGFNTYKNNLFLLFTDKQEDIEPLYKNKNKSNGYKSYL